MAFLPCSGIFLYLVQTHWKSIFCAEVGMELHFWRHSIAPGLPERGKAAPAGGNGVVAWVWL